MLRQPKDWNEARAVDGLSNFEQITPGGHLCVIVGAEVTTSRNGAEMLVLSLDIAENSEFDGMYRRAYESRAQAAKPGYPVAWPCRFWQLTQAYNDATLTNPRFRGLIKAVEESNPGFVWNWDEHSLINRRVGFIFREEEYESNQDSSIRTTVKPFACFPTHKLDEVTVPAKKLLERPQGGGFTAPAPSQAARPQQMSYQQFQQADENDDLPF